MYIHNFISPNIDEKDLELFFGPLISDDSFVTIQPNWLMAHITYRAGLFQSISQARKNGWNKPIPSGFSEHIIGKKRIHVYIFNLL